MRNCTIKIESNTRLDAARRAHDTNMRSMRHAKAELDQIAAIAQGVYNCASITASAAGSSSPWGQAIAGGAAAVGCGAAIIGAVAQYESIGVQTAMDDAEAQHQSLVASIGEETDVRLCLNEAHQQLVGVRTSDQQIARGLIDFAHVQYAMRGAVSDARRAYDEGRAEVAAAEGRAVRPPALDAWVDGRVGAFTRAMRQARLVSYLAERAVEYEFQGSLAARARILTAQTPAELSAALSELRSVSGTLGIGGRRPTQLKVVIQSARSPAAARGHDERGSRRAIALRLRAPQALPPRSALRRVRRRSVRAAARALRHRAARRAQATQGYLHLRRHRLRRARLVGQRFHRRGRGRWCGASRPVRPRATS